MPNVEIDGTNSTVKTNVLTSQSGTTITVPTTKVLTVTDAAGLTIAGATPAATSAIATQVAPSTSGNVLTSNGSAWTSAAAGGGGLNFISKITASNDATIDFLSSFSATYDTYLFTWYSTQPITDGSSFCFRVAQGGAAQTGGSYHRALKAHSEANGAGNNGATSNTVIYLSGTGTGNATVDEHCNGNIWVYNPLSSAVTGLHWQTWVNNQSNVMWYETGAGGYFANNTALTGCQFLYDSGNVSNGEFVLYGLAKS